MILLCYRYYICMYVYMNETMIFVLHKSMRVCVCANTYIEACLNMDNHSCSLNYIHSDEDILHFGEKNIIRFFRSHHR